MITESMYVILSAAPRESFHALPREGIFNRAELKETVFAPAFARLVEEQLLTRTDTHLPRYYCAGPGLAAMAEFQQAQDARALKLKSLEVVLKVGAFAAGSLIFALYMLLKAIFS